MCGGGRSGLGMCGGQSGLADGAGGGWEPVAGKGEQGLESRERGKGWGEGRDWDGSGNGDGSGSGDRSGNGDGSRSGSGSGGRSS